MANTNGIVRPRVFLDVSVGTEPIGRLTIELFIDKTPKTCENFRAICSGSNPPLTYKMSPFHRVIDDFMVQGGDITKGNGTGGASIYGDDFEDENLGWREMDAAGLVCMANRGKDTNSSQFFITLAPCEHLNNKHTIFGRLAAGQTTLEAISQVPVDNNDRPKTDVLVSHCGELERKTAKPSTSVVETRDDRGREKRRHRHSRSHSGSRQRHHKHSPQPVQAPGHEDRRRKHRRSDASHDHTFRGRPRSRTRSPVEERVPSASPTPHHKRKRSPSPSRHNSRRDRSRSRSHERRRTKSPGGYDSRRRRRSLPNQYHPRHNENGGFRYRDDEEALRREEWAREGGRLGGGWDDDEGGDDGSGVVYKGRGKMKFREKRW